jgi:hypothetical protein
MPESYPRHLAERVYEKLFRKLKSACPSLPALEQLFERLYFASLKREEAENVSCRIAYMERTNPDPKPPKRIVATRWQHYPLSQDLPFTVRNLTKLSKAVDPWSSTLAVDVDCKGELRIWGLIDQTVHFSTFAVKESDTGFEPPGIFQAVVEGVGEIAAYRGFEFLGRLRQDYLVTKQLAAMESGPVHDKLLPGIRKFQERVRISVGNSEYERRDHWDLTITDEWISALSRILIGIQRYAHGGAIYVSDTPDGLLPRYAISYPRLSEALYRKAVLEVHRTSYSDRIHEKFLDLDLNLESLPIDLYLDETVSDDEIDETENEITGCVRFLTSLSRVDGLVWFGHELALRGFGVLIGTEEEPHAVYKADNVSGTKLIEVDAHNFGTRHRSMMRQCWRDPQGVGFVVSQDGDVRAITSHEGKILIWESIALQRFFNTKGRRKKRDSRGRGEPGSEDTMVKG